MHLSGVSTNLGVGVTGSAKKLINNKFSVEIKSQTGELPAYYSPTSTFCFLHVS